MIDVNADCLGEFEAIIDVRSPLEFAHSHIPRAQNLFVLDDKERHIVGETYRRDPFAARMLGASLVCANMAQHLQGFAQRFHPSQKILAYCARGGQRSLSFAVILDNIGYRVARLSGGYKSYRSHVCSFFAKPLPLRLFVLYGLTGSGKTEIVRACKYGVDIEGIAAHRGSSFGGFGRTQPSAKMFQNELFEALDSKHIALVECESKRIGDLILPQSLAQSMQQGRKIEIVAPFESRVQRIVAEYGTMDSAFFHQSMEKIKPYMQKAAWQQCIAHFARGEIVRCVEILLAEYYDRVYRRVACDVRIEYRNLEETLRQIDDILEKSENGNRT